jgi:RNase P subunit RPR2
MSLNRALKPPKSAIPSVMCPRCHKNLWLATAEPEATDALVLYFICDCGFEYRMSDTSRAEYALVSKVSNL